jgi:predicted transcriptional regulator
MTTRTEALSLANEIRLTQVVERRAAALAMYSERQSAAHIARVLGVSPSTVWRYIREAAQSRVSERAVSTGSARTTSHARRGTA